MQKKLLLAAINSDKAARDGQGAILQDDLSTLHQLNKKKLL